METWYCEQDEEGRPFLVVPKTGKIAEVRSLCRALGPIWIVWPDQGDRRVVEYREEKTSFSWTIGPLRGGSFDPHKAVMIGKFLLAREEKEGQQSEEAAA